MLTNLVLVAVWALGIQLSRRVFADVFSPFCIYISSWCICLFLFRLQLLKYTELEVKTWLLMAGGMLSFSAGCLIFGAFSQKPRRKQVQVFTSLPWLRVAILTLLALDIMGFAFFAMRMSETYGLETYFTDPRIIRADAREWTSSGAIGVLMLLCYPLFAASLIYILESRKLTWLTVLGLLVPAAETYLLTDRLTLVVFFTCSFFVWIYHSKRTAFDRRALYLLTGGVICVLVYFIAVGNLYKKLVTPSSPTFQYSTISGDSELGVRLLDPYVYVTGSFPTFQAAVTDVDHFSWGTQTFYPAARLLYGIGVLERNPEASDFTFYFVPIPFNTYTWLYSFYCDFGICGVLLVPGLIGWFETWLYVRMKERPTVFSTSGSAALAAATTLTVCGFIQYDLILWNFLMVMFLVSKKTCSARTGSLRSVARRPLAGRNVLRPA